MIVMGPYAVDVWVDLETADEAGHVWADTNDVYSPEVFTPGKVVMASDDDSMTLAVVVGRERQDGQTRVELALVPGTLEEYVEAAVRILRDPCDG
jgi:hypothetical protein